MDKKPWSKLKKEIVKLWVEELNLDIHQAVYRMDSQMGHSDLPRYFLTLNKEIIYDFPKDFKNEVITSGWAKNDQVKVVYPYEGTVSRLSEVIREYIDTPVDEVLQKEFPQDFGLSLILKSADRRLGKAKLTEWSKTLPETSPVHKILKNRFKEKTNEKSST